MARVTSPFCVLRNRKDEGNETSKNTADNLVNVSMRRRSYLWYNNLYEG